MSNEEAKQTAAEKFAPKSDAFKNQFLMDNTVANARK